jgi:hypothetical protein
VVERNTDIARNAGSVTPRIRLKVITADGLGEKPRIPTTVKCCVQNAVLTIRPDIVRYVYSATEVDDYQVGSGLNIVFDVRQS